MEKYLTNYLLQIVFHFTSDIIRGELPPGAVESALSICRALHRQRRGPSPHSAISVTLRLSSKEEEFRLKTLTDKCQLQRASAGTADPHIGVQAGWWHRRGNQRIVSFLGATFGLSFLMNGGLGVLAMPRSRGVM